MSRMAGMNRLRLSTALLALVCVATRTSAIPSSTGK
jgi:hypothetical protein